MGNFISKNDDLEVLKTPLINKQSSKVGDGDCGNGRYDRYRHQNPKFMNRLKDGNILMLPILLFNTTGKSMGNHTDPYYSQIEAILDIDQLYGELSYYLSESGDETFSLASIKSGDHSLNRSFTQYLPKFGMSTTNSCSKLDGTSASSTNASLQHNLTSDLESGYQPGRSPQGKSPNKNIV